MKTGRPRLHVTREWKIHHLARRIFQTGRQYQQIASDRNGQIDFSSEQADKLQALQGDLNRLTARILRLVQKGEK